VQRAAAHVVDAVDVERRRLAERLTHDRHVAERRRVQIDPLLVRQLASSSQRAPARTGSPSSPSEATTKDVASCNGISIPLINDKTGNINMVLIFSQSMYIICSMHM